MSTATKSKPGPGKPPTGGRPADQNKQQAATMPQSAAAPSPFTPIADYAFLSNCHRGALIAPDGTVDWLCVPRFDSPSVFWIASRPGRWSIPARTVWNQRAQRPGLRARNEHASHLLEDVDRMGNRP
jgi:hypothetical protein